MKKEKGLFIVNTGDGKGKTSSALGVALRTIGYGGRVYLLYFMKEIKMSEVTALQKFGDQIDIEQAGAGFFKIRGDHSSEEQHRKMAAIGLKKAQTAITSGKYELVILDESLNAVDVGLITNKQLLDVVSKRKKSHIIVTGRNARKALIAKADMVSEMKKIKHPFDKRIYAKKGIDF
jgi:cob(I)alamin adenosyltransferase